LKKGGANGKGKIFKNRKFVTITSIITWNNAYLTSSRHNTTRRGLGRTAQKSRRPFPNGKYFSNGYISVRINRFLQNNITPKG